VSAVVAFDIDVELDTAQIKFHLAPWRAAEKEEITSAE
jgi:hypothetical protein